MALSDRNLSPDGRPTAEDMAVDLRARLARLDEAAGCVSRFEVPAAHRCAYRRALAAEKRVTELEADNVRLQAIVESLSARVVAQSDLLSRRAEAPEVRDAATRQCACPREHWQDVQPGERCVVCGGMQ